MQPIHLALLVLAVAVTVLLEMARRRRSADRDQARELLLRTLLDASPIAYVLCEDDGLIVADNEAARRLFFEGRTSEGQNFLRLVSNGSSPVQAALLNANDEILELTVEGQLESYHVSRRSLDYRGRRHALLSVRPMTREVARHDLDVLKKVVRLLSHEVNNSLAPVSSLVHSARQILASGERLERLTKVFDTVDDRARHLSQFIAGYASLARLPRPVPQTLAWSGLVSRLSLLYPEAQLMAPEGATGFFDPSQLEQALINLLKNANEAGGAKEAVQLEITPLEERAAELQILDRGRGFSPDALENALLPFFTTKPGGSGVGLALVREVVHAHGGRLTLGPREGGGAAIRVWLPGPRPQADLASRARLTLTRA